MTGFVLIWGHIFLSYVSFKENGQEKDRRIMCPEDASQEKADSQNGSYFVTFGKAVRIFWDNEVAITYLMLILLQIGEEKLCN